MVVHRAVNAGATGSSPAIRAKDVWYADGMTEIECWNCDLGELKKMLEEMDS